MPGRRASDALTGWLTERDVLLVIDNCEHVVAAIADLVEALTARLPRLRVLATSREPLWIDGEVTYRIAPLAVVGPDATIEEVAASTAVQLFRERAGARVRGALDTERSYRLFGEICRLETIRQYAVEQLTSAGEIDGVRERHARFYLGVALQACGGLMTENERPHLDVLGRIDDNLRVALARLLLIDPRAALSLSASLLPSWWIRGRLRDKLVAILDELLDGGMVTMERVRVLRYAPSKSKGRR